MCLVLEALKLAGREDLIGYDKRCLIRPKEGRGGYSGSNYGSGQSVGKSNSGRTAGKNSKPGASPKNTAGSKKAETPKKKKTIRNVHKKK